MDGTGLGRANAPHREPAVAFRTSQQSRGVSVWHSVERRRRVVPRGHGEPAVGISGDLDAGVISAHLYTIEAKNASVHAAGRIPRSNADADRMGWRVRR